MSSLLWEESIYALPVKSTRKERKGWPKGARGAHQRHIGRAGGKSVDRLSFRAMGLVARFTRRERGKSALTFIKGSKIPVGTPLTGLKPPKGG